MVRDGIAGAAGRPVRRDGALRHRLGGGGGGQPTRFAQFGGGLFAGGTGAVAVAVHCGGSGGGRFALGGGRFARTGGAPFCAAGTCLCIRRPVGAGGAGAKRHGRLSGAADFGGKRCGGGQRRVFPHHAGMEHGRLYAGAVGASFRAADGGYPLRGGRNYGCRYFGGGGLCSRPLGGGAAGAGVRAGRPRGGGLSGGGHPRRRGGAVPTGADSYGGGLSLRRFVGGRILSLWAADHGGGVLAVCGAGNVGGGG